MSLFLVQNTVANLCLVDHDSFFIDFTHCPLSPDKHSLSRFLYLSIVQQEVVFEVLIHS